MAVAAAPFFVSAADISASVTVAILPNAPSNLSAMTNSQSEIDLSWTDNSMNEDGFVVERQTGSSGFVQVATVPANVTIYYDSSLVPDTVYNYRVAAYDSDGFSAFSNTASATTIPANEVPLTASTTLLEDSGAFVTAADTGTSTITIFPAVTNPFLDLRILANGGDTAVIPGAINVNGSGVSVSLPAELTVTVGTTTWSGLLDLPQATTTYAAPIPDAGYTASVVTAIEIGLGDTPVALSAPIEIVFPGQAGDDVGWSRGDTFTAIAASCDAATPPTVFDPSGNCVTSSGSDLIVWTTDLATYVTYEQTPIPTGTYIASINPLPAISVANGTPLGAIGLPDAVTAYSGQGSSLTVPVAWDGGTPTYNSSAPGTYTFIGTITPPAGVTNSNNLKASESVVVASASSPPPSSGGGGGGGGGGGYVPPTYQTSAVFKGIAYPGSNITLLENAQVAAVTQAGPDAKFEIDVSNFAPGTYTFGVWGSDPAGNRSETQTFTVTVENGAMTVISGIFLPPTLSVDRTQVKQGDVVTFLGYTAPGANVTVTVHSTNDIVNSVASEDSGAWIYKLNTSPLDYGSHTAGAFAATGTAVSPTSELVAFTVGNENVSAPPPASSACIPADLNCDGRVNLVDFSIMAYWFGRPNPPARIDLNHDGKIDLVDFSILAYYWTG